MKKFLLLLAVPFVAIGAIKNSALLTWYYPPEELPNVRFNVWSTTNLTAPNWIVITNVLGTNTLVPIPIGNMFWTVTATNEFGESGPSNISTSTVARNVNGLKIK